MKQLHFFAAKEDLQSLLRAVERRVSISYVRMGPSSSTVAERFASGDSIPNLGRAERDSAAACDEYLVIPDKRIVEVRPVRTTDGTLQYFVDQLSNPNSVTFAPGGIWSKEVLLNGRVATVHDDADSQNLMKNFASELRKSFHKVKAYWVGPQAEVLLDAGGRLTISAHASRDFDLTRSR